MASIVAQSPIRRNSKRNSHEEISMVGAIADEHMLKTESSFAIKLRQGSLSETDKKILTLIQDIPLKRTPSECMENFLVYPTALRVYQIVSANKLPYKEGVSIPNRATRRKVYQLVFDALYYREVLEDLLVESSFYSRHFHLHADEALVHIMLFDFQDSKFTLRLRFPKEHCVPDCVVRVADALWQHRTKLNATLARMRVEADALKISKLIPNPVARKICENNSFFPCYARVNPIKVGNVQKEVVNQLLNEGVVLVRVQEDLIKYSRTMCILQKDLLVFSPSCRMFLDTHPLVERGFIVLQDVPSYKFVDRIRHKIEKCSGDIIVTECNSGTEVAHIATVLGYRGTVLVYNTQPVDTDQIQAMLCTLEVTNVKLMDIPFVCSSYDENIFDDAQMIICLSPAPCILGHCVDYALQQDHSLPVMLQPPKSGARETTGSHSLFYSTLTSALTFDQVENIFLAFTKDSKSNSDSESIVEQLLEQYNIRADRVGLKNFHMSTGTHYSTDQTKCCIISVQREPDRPPTPPREVIDRAIANGIIDGEGISSGKSAVLKKCKKGSSKVRFKTPFHYHNIPMTIAAQQKIVQKKDQKSAKKVFRV